jgi:hypothetical protein
MTSKINLHYRRLFGKNYKKNSKYSEDISIFAFLLLLQTIRTVSDKISSIFHLVFILCFPIWSLNSRTESVEQCEHFRKDEASHVSHADVRRWYDIRRLCRHSRNKILLDLPHANFLITIQHLRSESMFHNRDQHEYNYELVFECVWLPDPFTYIFVVWIVLSSRIVSPETKQS